MERNAVCLNLATKSSLITSGSSLLAELGTVLLTVSIFFFFVAVYIYIHAHMARER